MLAADVIDRYPLSPVQQGMLVHRLEGSNVGVDIEQMVGDLHESIDAPLLERAWRRIIARHPIMRSQLRWDGTSPAIQEVLAEVPVVLDVRDLTNVASEEQQARIDAFLDVDRRAGFRLEEAPLFRLTLLRLGADHDVFVFTYHHSLLDTAVVWVVEEAFRTYDASRRDEVAELEERRPYRDHILWLQDHLVEDRAAARQYYAELLEGFDEPTRLTSLSAAADQVHEPGEGYGARRFGVDAAVSAAFHELAARPGASGGAIVEAVWGLVLAAFSGSTDVVFGSTRGCRRSGLPGSDRTIGLFINTPPVRLRFDASQTFLALVESVRRQQQDKRRHEHTPLTEIQSASEIRAGGLFETITVINELHQGTRIKQEGGPAFAGREFDLHDQTNFPLTLLGYLDPEIRFKLSSDRRVFDDAAMARVHDLFVEILAAAVADPHAPVSSLPRIPAIEAPTMERWNDTARPLPHAATVHSLFAAQVAATPDAIAVVVRNARVTYRELDERANALAARLVDLGVVPDTMVGIYLDRSVDMVVALLAVLKAGGAYVPMDPQYPQARIGMMIEDTRAEIVLTQRRLSASVPGDVPHILAVDDLAGARSVAAPAVTSGPAHLAYVIFTSGSTGRPKGVMIEHRNVVNFFVAMDEQLQHTPSPNPGVWLAVTSISFDISVLELFWTLTRGFTVVVQEDEGRLSTQRDATTVALAPAPKRHVDFSLFYFAADASAPGTNRYQLLLDGARFADTHGFSAVWTPERHFHEFGGNYPNAAITSAAIAMVTERIGIRAGSVVLPLHNPIRAAEDWSMVDNLSGGRVGLSFASGWHANDFALAPDNFADRRKLMAEGIDTVRKLWLGESVPAVGGDGREISVRIYPPPVQPAPPIWITAGGSADTFAMAGRIGANILTNLLVMSEADLVKNIATYRAAYREAGHPGEGTISLMLHTFVGERLEDVRAIVRTPFLDYLRTSTDLINQVSWEQTSFAKPDAQRGAVTAGPNLDDLEPDEIAVIMDHAFERYFRSAGLFGTPETCLATVDRLRDLGIDEIACLIDFGVDESAVLAGLEQLDQLRRLSATDATPPIAPIDRSDDTDDDTNDEQDDDADYGLVAQVERHHVTHLQCTPSMAGVVAATADGMSALAGLRQLLLGGEALPPALVARLVPAMNGRLLNMYGPTETTIWSTVSEILDGEAPITIGRPIANTRIHVVDRNLLADPIGVAGELLIGGDGVVRGYLDRPELTAERFVHLRGSGERVYRTGDLVRLRPDGEIEFSGRLDHQVKVRGYRIELGEIEAAIGRHPGVAETVVVARTETPGDPRLVAYVVPRAAAGADDVDAWGTIWDETYGASDGTDASFDIAGWNDSYTGEPIPAAEMQHWVDETVSRILDLRPRRVIEIGCGTGLLLFRVAPHCEHYTGIDLSRHAVDRIRAGLSAHSITNVDAVVGAAHDVAALDVGPADVIVINSVAQYFPSAEYFVDVVTRAMQLLAPGGALFLGDLRSRAHLPLFATSIELARAPADAGAGELRAHADQRVAQDRELVIDASLFAAIAATVPEIGAVEVMLKDSADDNEMTRFRYDVVLRRRPLTDTAVVAAVDAPVVDGRDLDGLATVRDALAARPDVLRVTGVRDDRVVREMAAVRAVAGSADGSVADLRAHLQAVAPGWRPGDFAALDADYRATSSWSADEPDRFDVVLRARSRPTVDPVPAVVPLAWSAYTNRPDRTGAGDLGPQLRSALRATLPDYMVPTAFVVLEAMPRTPNGKIDRAALPAPDRARREEGQSAVAPGTDLERTISAVWEDILSLDTVGVETNLFDLGANSLMMVQASGRLGEVLGRRLSLVELFGHPTIRALAAHIGASGTGDSKASQQGQDRAKARMEAMQRQRTARRPARRS